MIVTKFFLGRFLLLLEREGVAPQKQKLESLVYSCGRNTDGKHNVYRAFYGFIFQELRFNERLVLVYIDLGIKLTLIHILVPTLNDCFGKSKNV